MPGTVLLCDHCADWTQYGALIKPRSNAKIKIKKWDS